jgi:hypothetical protein
MNNNFLLHQIITTFWLMKRKDHSEFKSSFFRLFHYTAILNQLSLFIFFCKQVSGHYKSITWIGWKLEVCSACTLHTTKFQTCQKHINQPHFCTKINGPSCYNESNHYVPFLAKLLFCLSTSAAEGYWRPIYRTLWRSINSQPIINC